MDKEAVKEEDCSASVSTDYEETCWGCRSRLRLPSYSRIFKCGWCGAITNRNQSARTPDTVCFARWRLIRDRSFVAILILFVFFVICAGVWAVLPIVFSISYLSPGAPVNISWGSYSLVPKDGLESYTFCIFCEKPKPPRAHHCRSCRMCVLDMDHHCPFIGNCVGAANHRSFILFLISIVISCIYVILMTSYSLHRVWPPVDFTHTDLVGLNSFTSWRVLKQTIAAIAYSALFLSARGFILIYLAFSSISVEIGICVLLWQQLYYIYEGNTYINHISSKDSVRGDRGCHNLLRFFGWQYSTFRFLLSPANTAKLQESESSKLL